MSQIKIFLIGDIVGKPGRRILQAQLHDYVQARNIDLVIANGENAARGSGITEKLFTEVTSAGVNLVTMGDHVWKRKDIISLLQSRRNLLRPANLPDACPGYGSTVVRGRSNTPVGVMTVLGRIFMEPSDCPFRCAERTLATLKAQTPIVFLEVHAEATSEKIAMGWRFAGQASCVFGTHTHVQTADERVLPGGTAYITDLGMTGPHESVIGRDIKSVLFKFENLMHASFTVASGDVRINGALVTVDTDTGRALAIERVTLTDRPADGSRGD